MKGLAPSPRKNRHPTFDADVGSQRCRVLSGGGARLLAQPGRKDTQSSHFPGTIMGQIDGRVNEGLPYNPYEFSKNLAEK